MTPALRELLMETPPWLRPNYPRTLPNLAAWFDALDIASMVVDSSNRVSLLADKSGKSNVNCLVLNGSSGNYASAPDSNALDITGDIQVDIDLAPDAVVPSGYQCFGSKATSSGNQCSWFVEHFVTTGYVNFGWSETGNPAAAKQRQSTAALPISNYGKIKLRITLDVDNGAGGHTVTFYTSTDGVTWTQLGSAVTTAGTTSIYAGTSPLYIGAYNGGSAEFFAGKIYRFQVYNGIGGTLAFDFNPALSAKLATTATDQSANAATITINTSGDTGARICGARDAYFGSPSKQPVLLRHEGRNYGYFNAGNGNYVNTPDAAGLTPAGDFAGKAFIRAVDYTPSAEMRIMGHCGSGGNRGWHFTILASGKLEVELSYDGSSLKTFDSSVATGITDQTDKWVAFTVDVDNGAGGTTVTYWTSDDGVTWSQLGTPVTVAATGTLYNTTAAFEVGSFNSGANVFNGRIYYAALLNTSLAGATLAAFDPSRYTSGPTFTAATGETWTLNGGACIVTRTGLCGDGVDDALQTAAFAMSDPCQAYLVYDRVNTGASYQNLYDLGADLGTLFYNTGGTTELRLYAGGQVVVGSYADRQARLASVTWDGSASYVRVNRTAAAGPLNPGAITHSKVTLFTNGVLGSGRNTNMLLHEFALYSGRHAAGQSDRFALYAGRRHRYST